MSKKHGLIMMAGCLIAFGAAAAVFLFNVPPNNVFIVLMFLLCPLSHLLMIGLMSRHDHAGEKYDGHQQNPTPLTAPKELGEG